MYRLGAEEAVGNSRDADLQAGKEDRLAAEACVEPEWEPSQACDRRALRPQKSLGGGRKVGLQ